MNTESKDFRTFGLPHWAWLLLLTLLAGCLRFSSLDKPSVWGDEAASWRRVAGSWQQMVDELRLAGFMPGHYVTLWWIKEGFPYWGEYREGPPSEVGFGRGGFRSPEERRAGRGPRLVWTPTHRLVDEGIEPSPAMLRFIPALCGTLMVPAIYFLASQLVARRTALLAALFAAVSAYLLNYSRDSKMYMQLWFFATLHVGCLLWWLKAYSARPPPTPTLSAKERELGEGVAGVLPATHVDQVARAFLPPASPGAMVLDDVTARLGTFVRWACWLVSGLAMISFHAVGLGIVGIEVLIFLATIPLRLGWMRRLWPPGSRDPDRLPFWRNVFVPPIVGFALGTYLIVGLFSSYREFTRFYERVEPTEAESAQFDINDMGIAWVDRYNHGRSAAGHFLENATAYLFNWEWIKTAPPIADGSRQSWDQTDDIDPVTLGRLRWAGIILLVSIGVGLLPLRRLAARITSSPRRFERGPMPATALFVVVMWAAIPAYGFYLASGAWDGDGNRAAAPTPNSTIVGAFLPGVKDGPEADAFRGALTTQLKPVFLADRPVGEAWQSLKALPWRILLEVPGFDGAGVRWWTGAAVAALAVVVALSWPTPPIAPARDDSTRARRRRRAWAAGLLLHLARVGIACGVLWLLMVVAFLAVPPQGRSVWMPRYLGFVWPAFAIGVCVLIRRLPLAPVRWTVVTLLVGVNLVQFYARLEHGEPPTAAIAADQVAVGDRRAARFFSLVEAPPGYGSPGSGFVGTVPNTYYYALMTGTPLTPQGVLGFPGRLGVIRLDGRSGNLAGTLSRDRQVTDAYIWATLPPTSDPGDLAGRIAASIGTGWSPAEPPRRWMVYEHWTWRRLYVAERHHWTREPATRPAASTRPTTTATSRPR